MAARRLTSFLLRLLCTVAALYIVYVQINLPTFIGYLQNIKISWLLLALLAFNAGQLAGALRYRYYLASAGVAVSLKDSLILHYRGLMLNTLLPGGISGDGYKAFVLRHHFPHAIKRLIKLTISNRLSGLAWLWLWVVMLMPFSSRVGAIVPQAALAAVFLFALSCVGYSLLAKLFLDEPPAVQLPASCYSFALQGMMVATAGCIILALQGDPLYVLDYIIVFLAACVVATFPISIGGIGIRELVLMNGSALLGIDPHFGAALAVIFFILYLLTGLFAVVLPAYHPKGAATPTTP